MERYQIKQDHLYPSLLIMVINPARQAQVD